LPSVLLLLAMHAPDGLFSLSVNLTFGLVVAVFIGRACAALSRAHDQRLVPLMGLMAAFVFAGQMVNFPISAGTTGHLLGGTLAAILLGPWAATVVMAAVILFQALLGDGGLTALGPNIFNMGIVGTCLAYFVYRAFAGAAVHKPARVVAASFFAAWVSVPLASVFVSLQLAVSGTATLARALPAMVLTHMVIGVGEALITAGVVAFVVRTRADLLYDRPAGTRRRVGRLVAIVGLAGSLAVATGLSLLPRLWDFPDGLESVGFQKGFLYEEPALAADGTVETFSAYPLGVRLALHDGRATAIQRHEQQASPLMPGDVIERIESTPVADLAAAAQALGFEPAENRFALSPGQPVHVRVERAGRELELVFPAAATPAAGTARSPIALLPDYTVPGLTGLLSTSVAGAIGTLVMFLAAFVAGRALVRPIALAACAETQASGEPRRA